MGELKVEVKVDKDAGTLTISDRGIGMTAEEIDKYINQIAFSGANDFLPIIAIIIKLQSPGPIFFKQKRTGLNGADFYCYKFRSMHINAEADKLQCTENDPRKFAFGNLMRKTNIDELPQFFNVLRGDMSVVGPRP